MRCEIRTYKGEVFDFEGTREELDADVRELGGPEAVMEIRPVPDDDGVQVIDF
jgi:hypothetical protein